MYEIAAGSGSRRGALLFSHGELAQLGSQPNLRQRFRSFGFIAAMFDAVSTRVALPARALGRAVENLVDLSRHDEVILVQSLYFLRLQVDRCIAPAEADVRMMAFGLSEFTDLLDKGHCFAKVAEPEGPLDTMSVVAEFPVRGLRTEAFGFLMSEWWDATTAGRACFLGKSFGHLRFAN